MKINYHAQVSIICIILTLSIWNLKDFQFTDDSNKSSNNFIIIIKHYGSDAVEIERSITIPLEKNLKEVKGIKKITSQTEYESVRITVEMKSNTTFNGSYPEIRDKVYSFYEMLPESVQKPQIYSSSNSDQPAIIMSIESSILSNEDLQKVADERIKKDIERIVDVGEVQLGGLQKNEIIVDINKEKTAALKLNLKAINSILKQNYTHSITGVIHTENYKYIVTSNGLIESIDELKNIEFPIENGSVKLSTFADVYYRPREPDSISRINNENKLVYYIKLSGSGSAIALSEKISNLIEKEENHRLEFDILYNFGDELKTSIKHFIYNILICIFVVGVFIFIALKNIQQTLIVSISIPFYAIITISFLHLINLPIGLSTLLGLGLAVGTVADSAIIIIYSNKKERESKTLFTSLVSSAITTVIVTIPLIISDSVSINVQKIALSFFLFIILSTSLNLLILRQLPYHNLIISKKEILKNTLHKLIDLNPKVIYIICFCLILFTGISIIFIPKSLNESSSSNTISIHLELPAGSKLDYIDSKIIEVVNDFSKIKSIDEIESHARNRNGSITVNFNEKLISREDLLIKLSEMKENYRDVEIFLPEKRDTTQIGITITGSEVDIIREHIDRVTKVFNDKNWVSGIVYNFKEGSPAYTFIPDKNLGYSYDISPNEIFSRMNQALNGPVALKWQEDGEFEKDLRVYIDANKYSDISDLKNLPIKLTEGIVPLEMLGSFNNLNLNNTIYRTNLQRSLSLAIFIDSKKIDWIYTNLKDSMNSVNFTPGYSYRIDESLINSKKETNTLFIYLLLSLFLIYGVLVITLDSFRLPILVLLTIPLSLNFSVILIILLKFPFTTEIFVGFIIVMGLIVNNSIIITDVFLELVKGGMNRKTSIFESVKSRSTSLLLTTGSTCIGYLPIIIGIGNIENRIQYIAAVIFSGTLGSFIIGIYIYPVLLYNFTKLRSKNET